MAERTIQLKGGVFTSDKRLDRVPEFDDRSRNFQMRAELDRMGVAPSGKAARSRAWAPNVGLNQRSHGACVRFSMGHILNGSPHRKISPNVETDDSSVLNYFEIQKIDPWPGGAYSGADPQYEGTSVLTGLKYARDKGEIGGFRWCGAGSGTAIEDVVDTLGYFGWVQFGLPWFDSMFDPRPSGLLEVDIKASEAAGGHAIGGFAVRLRARLKGEGTKPKAVIALQQSWGEDEGVAGYQRPGGIIFIEIDKLQALLEYEDDPGEAAVPWKEGWRHI